MTRNIVPDNWEKLSKSYFQDGHLFPIEVLTSDKTNYYLQALRNLTQDQDKRSQGVLRRENHPAFGDRSRTPSSLKSHLVLPWLDELIRLPAILDPVNAILGPNIFCWSTSFFIKEPSDPHFVSWHQDATYWNLSSDEVVTAWIALTDSSTENGCMKFWSGSHCFQQLSHEDKFHPNNLLGRGQEVQVNIEPEDTVDVVLRAGEMSLHHVLMIHGSDPNRSKRPRIGVAIRYIPTRNRQISLNGTAMLVRGIDNYNNFKHEQAPSGYMLENDLDYMEKINVQNDLILYSNIK